jgi:hypothetical protein
VDSVVVRRTRTRSDTHCTELRWAVSELDALRRPCRITRAESAAAPVIHATMVITIITAHLMPPHPQ